MFKILYYLLFLSLNILTIEDFLMYAVLQSSGHTQYHDILVHTHAMIYKWCYDIITATLYSNNKIIINIMDDFIQSANISIKINKIISEQVYDNIRLTLQTPSEDMTVD